MPMISLFRMARSLDTIDLHHRVLTDLPRQRCENPGRLNRVVCAL
jgi:hypothetical protein